MEKMIIINKIIYKILDVAKRIIFAILLLVAGFYLMPLAFIFNKHYFSLWIANIAGCSLKEAAKIYEEQKKHQSGKFLFSSNESSHQYKPQFYTDNHRYSSYNDDHRYSSSYSHLPHNIHHRFGE